MCYQPRHSCKNCLGSTSCLGPRHACARPRNSQRNSLGSTVRLHYCPQPRVSLGSIPCWGLRHECARPRNSRKNCWGALCAFHHHAAVVRRHLASAKKIHIQQHFYSINSHTWYPLCTRGRTKIQKLALPIITLLSHGQERVNIWGGRCLICVLTNLPISPPGLKTLTLLSILIVLHKFLYAHFIIT